MATPVIQDLAEEVIERLSRISLLVTIGHIIAGFPTGQRVALLVDLAKRANVLDTDKSPYGRFCPGRNQVAGLLTVSADKSTGAQ